jgi:hypothetical protein
MPRAAGAFSFSATAAFGGILRVMGFPLSADTSPAAERIQLDVLRRMPPWRKLKLVADANRTAQLLCIAGLRGRHPGESEEQLDTRYLCLVLQDELAARVIAERRRRR